MDIWTLSKELYARIQNFPGIYPRVAMLAHSSRQFTNQRILCYTLNERAVSAYDHPFLAPREHNVYTPTLLQEPDLCRPHERDDDEVRFVALEGIDIEDLVFEGELLELELIFDVGTLRIVWCNYPEGQPSLR